MRIAHRYLRSDSHTKVIKPIRLILDKYNIPYEYKEDPECVLPSHIFNIEFYLYEDNPNFNEVKRKVDKFELYCQTGTYYDDADFDKADWFLILKGEYQYPQPDGDFGYLSATFNLDNYCEHCGIGKVQNAPFRLKTEPKQHNNQFWGLHWEFESVFVRQEARNILEREAIKGISFSSVVIHKKNTEIEGFYQLHVNTILENGFNNYNTKTITCKTNNEEGCNTDPNLGYCGRIKYHPPRFGGYLFEQSAFKPGFDIVKTSEYFGSGCSAQKLIIVSKRFKELVEKNKLKGLAFKPIVHEKIDRKMN